MSKSVEEQLEEAEAARSTVLTRGQRVTDGTREIWRADLGAADKVAQRLERKARRKSAGGIRTQRIVPL